MTIPRLSLFVALCCAFSLSTVPEASAQVRPVGEAHFIVGLPQGAFADQVDAGFGGNVFGGLAFERAPVVLGLDLGFLVYGIERRSEPFSTTIPDVTVDVRTTNNIFMGHLVMRFQPSQGVVRPYADALFGFKYLFTETTIQDEGFNDNESIASSTNFDDAALSYGVGGGIDIRVYRHQESEPEASKLRAVHISLGARYLLGQEASYLKKGSIERRNGEVAFDTEQSRTDLLVPHVGIALTF